jgi:hypothetical protein
MNFSGNIAGVTVPIVVGIIVQITSSYFLAMMFFAGAGNALLICSTAIDFRGPRKIKAASNRRHLWGEQHRIEPRTKRNHWWENLGCLTSDDHFSRSEPAPEI